VGYFAGRQKSGRETDKKVREERARLAAESERRAGEREDRFDFPFCFHIFVSLCL